MSAEQAHVLLIERGPIPLMFEAWEIDLARDDVDLDALGIRFSGTDERPAAVDVFSCLGPTAARLNGGLKVAGVLSMADSKRPPTDQEHLNDLR